MQIAVYIFHELLIRLQELNPAVGEYTSFKLEDNEIEISTSNGYLKVSQNMLERQLTDPSTISQQELIKLLDSFKLGA